MELLVFLLAVLFFLWLKGRIRADRPGATQQVMEFLLVNPMGVGIKDLLDDIVGHGSDQHIPLIGTIALFIFMSNMLAVVPGLMSPTAAVTVPLGCAIVVFIYYNRFGLKKHGVGGYAKTLLGPVPAISPDHVHRGNVQPLRAAAFAHRSSLGEHDGERIDFRFVPGTFDRAVYVPGTFECDRVCVGDRAGGNSAGAHVLSYFRSGAASIHFYDFFHRVSWPGNGRRALIRT